MLEAKLYKQLNNNVVQCDLCNHFCAIKNSEVGKCRARQNKNGKLFSLVYGYPVAINTDPIEKKPLFHFSPASLTYSFGTFGCNFKCANCQNWDISQANNIAKLNEKLEYIEPQQIIDGALSEDCSSIAYTYNEPTIFFEYALAIMKLARQNGLKNIWVSNGFMSEQCLEAIIPYLDAANIDLKSMSEDFYSTNCNGQLQPILNNLIRLKQEQVHLEIITLIIPNLSDDAAMLKEMAEFIVKKLGVETPWHLSRFSPEISWQLKKIPATTAEAIYEAYEIGKAAGLQYVYVGNLPGDAKENTYCPHCDSLAIERNGYEITRHDLEGNCYYCEKSLDIIG
jgi:pyruvate formate lyase activating enzyme